MIIMMVAVAGQLWWWCDSVTKMAMIMITLMIKMEIAIRGLVVSY
jgi:hypothetical protein